MEEEKNEKIPNGGNNPETASRETAYIEAATAGSNALVKIFGLGDMHLALVLDDLCALLAEKGSLQLAIDLSGCTGMDSTFMGTLVTISASYADLGGWMCVVNVSPENCNLMKMLGVSKFITTKESFHIDPLKVARLYLPSTDNAAKRLKLIKKAHERLVAIDERNQEKFGAFLQMLNASMAGAGIDTADSDNADSGPAAAAGAQKQ